VALLVERAEEISPRQISVPATDPDRSSQRAVAVLVGLPLVVFALPALLGHPVLSSDNLTQNFPLRVLVGAQIRSGQLPLYDPYIWSGAPLLGGWNAGAAYPLTLLFAVMSGTVAWTLNLVVTWWIAGLGTFAFLRASRLSPLASFLGALTFAFTGAMAAQVPHFGLVAGMSWVPVVLLALLRLSDSRALRARVVWISALAGAGAMVILAGEPRAIDDAVVAAGLYALWRVWRLGRGSGAVAYAGSVGIGAALAAMVGAVQWVPGLDAVATSQRAAHTMALFDSGSLAPKWLLLSIVPNLLGGSGWLGSPAFFAHYSLAEVTGYVGLMPLVAAVALLGRLRLHQRLPEWVIWHVMALTGVVLALGGNTVLGPVLVHLPLFGGQRLQSRNIMIADLALAVLLAYWVDIWLRQPRLSRRRLPAPRQLLGVVPGAAAVVIVIVTLAWGAGMLRWLGLNASMANSAGPAAPWLAPFLALGIGAVALVVWGPRLDRRRRTRVLVGFVVLDVTIFTLLLAISPSPLLTPSPAPKLASSSPASASGGNVDTTPPVVPLSALVHGGRFAVYDPDLLDSGELTELGAADSNVISETPSVEGYSSIVDSTYAQETGSHQALGEGQNVLDPQAIGNGTLDQLDTTVLVTPAAYLVTPTLGASAADPQTGRRQLAPGQSTTWYLGSPLDVASVTVPVNGRPGALGPGTRIGLVAPSGSTRWTVPGAHSGDDLEVSLDAPLDVVALKIVAGAMRIDLGPPVVETAAGAGYRADGQLQDALAPPRWRYGGVDGSFAVFDDSLARPSLTIRALPGGSSAGTRIKATAGPAFAPTRAAVSSSRGATVVRAVADIPGWSATWHRSGSGAAESLAVVRSGIVQAVTVPPGRGTVTWTYVPPGFRLGLWASSIGVVVLVGLGVGILVSRRRSPRLGAGPHPTARRVRTAPYRRVGAPQDRSPWRPFVVRSVTR
jgi:hypothetical protein